MSKCGFLVHISIPVFYSSLVSQTQPPKKLFSDISFGINIDWLKWHYYLSFDRKYHINFMFNYTLICEFEIFNILITYIFILYEIKTSLLMIQTCNKENPMVNINWSMVFEVLNKSKTCENKKMEERNLFKPKLEKS